MIIVASGDSNTWGVEVVPPRFTWDENVRLSPTPTADDLAEIEAYRAAHVWPARLGARIGAGRVVNLAQQGASNHRIARVMLEWIGHNLKALREHPERYVFVCGWTTHDRFEVYNETLDQWDLYGPNFGRREPIGKFFYENIHSNVAMEYETWSDLIMVQNTLAVLGIRLISFFCYYDPNDCPHDLIGLVDWTKMAPLNMYNRLRAEGFKPGPGQHFLADAHERWAEIIAELL